MTWWALAMVFASLPGICFVGYCYQCGYTEERRTFRGYVDLVRSIYKAKSEGQKEASRVLAGRQAPIFCLLITVILFLIPKDTPLVVTVNLACIPAGELAFWFGRRNRIADGVPVADAKKVLAKLPPPADFRQTTAVLWVIGLWVALVALAWGGAVLWDKLMK